MTTSEDIATAVNDPKSIFSVTDRHDIYPGIDPKPIYDAQALRGKVVFIAGASRGIGAEIALTYARAGATLVITARSQAGLDAVKSEINSENPNAIVVTVIADVTITEQVKAAVETAVAKFGKIDIVVANAGQAEGCSRPFTKTDPYVWWKTVEVNLRGVFNVGHFALPHLDKSKGYLVIISSAASQLRIPFSSSYAISKHAVNRFNEFIAMEHPDVKTFALHPGAVKTRTGMTNPEMEAYLIDSPRLPAATVLRLTSGRDNYLSGRYVSSAWDLDEVEQKYKTKIIDQEALVSRLSIPL